MKMGELEWWRRVKWRSTEEQERKKRLSALKDMEASRLYFRKIRTIPTGDAI